MGHSFVVSVGDSSSCRDYKSLELNGIWIDTNLEGGDGGRFRITVLVFFLEERRKTMKKSVLLVAFFPSF
jgi:hypothetical protein